VLSAAETFLRAAAGTAIAHLSHRNSVNQETDGHETDNRPRTEKLKWKEITLTEN